MKTASCVLAVVLISAGFPAAAQPSADPAESAFHQAVARYLDLRARLRNEIPPLAPLADGAEIVRRSDTLAAALQRARAAARPGDIFSPEVSKTIALRLRGQLEGVDINLFLVRINDEPTTTGPPQIHMRFPMGASMATTPTRLLDALPALPDALEYRLVGRTLVLRDRDAAMIVDYIVDVLPGR